MENPAVPANNHAGVRAGNLKRIYFSSSMRTLGFVEKIFFFLLLDASRVGKLYVLAGASEKRQSFRDIARIFVR